MERYGNHFSVLVFSSTFWAEVKHIKAMLVPNRKSDQANISSTIDGSQYLAFNFKIDCAIKLNLLFYFSRFNLRVCISLFIFPFGFYFHSCAIKKTGKKMIMDSSAIVLLSSNTILMVLTCGVIAVLVFLVEYTGAGTKAKETKSLKSTTSDDMQRPPGPKPWPIIGNLACLNGYEVPFQAFDDLAKKYGAIISLRLGSVPTVVVNGIDNIKEVLITKSSHFDSRPNFRRYHELFSGNKQNCKYFLNMISFYLILSFWSLLNFRKFFSKILYFSFEFLSL